jgi:SAM-dependent methyltransferase
LTEEFDAISCFHVIEHLPSPRAFLRSCARALPVSGCLLIEVPDYGSRSAGLLKGRWPHLYPDIHLYQFTEKTLCKLLTTERLRVVSVRRQAGRAFLDSSSGGTGQSHGSGFSFRDALFSLRHVVYWNPWARHIIRRAVWDVLKRGEFLRIRAVRTS